MEGGCIYRIQPLWPDGRVLAPIGRTHQPDGRVLAAAFVLQPCFLSPSRGEGSEGGVGEGVGADWGGDWRLELPKKTWAWPAAFCFEGSLTPRASRDSSNPMDLGASSRVHLGVGMGMGMGGYGWVWVGMGLWSSKVHKFPEFVLVNVKTVYFVPKCQEAPILGMDERL